MKKILRSTVVAAASVASILSIPHAKQESGRHKKQRASTQPRGGSEAPPPEGKPGQDGTEGNVPSPSISELANMLVIKAPPMPVPKPQAVAADRYPWRKDIVTTTFWIGEKAAKNNPVPNRASSWDKDWAENYGGTDTPDRNARVNFRPAAFLPGQNPFYVALPYNDMQMSGHKSEASKVVPWFQDEYRGPWQSVCKGRWLAIRFKGRTVYAQWEDCGPFRTDHHEYVFGEERPKKNINKGAGLDVSPAVRDYLGMNDTDVTDWKFVEFAEVPDGPWAKYGENNTFVINRRLDAKRLAALRSDSRAPE